MHLNSFATAATLMQELQGSQKNNKIKLALKSYITCAQYLHISQNPTAIFWNDLNSCESITNKTFH